MTNAKTSSAEPCDKCETEWADEKKRRESWKSAHTPAPKIFDPRTRWARNNIDAFIFKHWDRSKAALFNVG